MERCIVGRHARSGLCSRLGNTRSSNQRASEHIRSASLVTHHGFIGSLGSNMPSFIGNQSSDAITTAPNENKANRRREAKATAGSRPRHHDATKRLDGVTSRAECVGVPPLRMLCWSPPRDIVSDEVGMDAATREGRRQQRDGPCGVTQAMCHSVVRATRDNKTMMLWR